MSNAEKRAIFEKTATGYFKQGLNCAECVLKAYLDVAEGEFDPKVVAMASGFGGGIGRTGHNTCGALVGACMALGCEIGRKDPLAKETPKERIAELVAPHGLYPAFADLSTAFAEVFGSTICHDMCRVYVDHESIERKRNCKEAIRAAAAIVAGKIFPDEA